MEAAEFGKMCREYMGQHGLLDAGWYYAYDNAKRRLGQCDFDKKVLSFSLPILQVNNLEVNKDTILHEIAHALVGWREKHGYWWKRKA